MALQGSTITPALQAGGALTAAGTTSPADISQMYGCAITATAAGSAFTGSVKLQVSNEYPTPKNWVDVPSSQQAISGSMSVAFAESGLYSAFIRGSVAGSGTGMSVVFTGFGKGSGS